MTHFTVLLKITPERLKRTAIDRLELRGAIPATVKAMLAPYQENNMGDCPEEYLAFNDHENEYRKKYKTETCDMVRMPDGQSVSKYDDRFKKVDPDKMFSSGYVVPRGCVEEEVPLCTRYTTFEEYMADYCGEDASDPKTGRYGYWENPDAKWDWYQIGGRWHGMLRMKEGVRGGLGEPSPIAVGQMGDEARAKRDEADYARVKDIDFEGMVLTAKRSARDFYREYLALKKKVTDQENDHPGTRTGDRHEKIASKEYSEALMAEFNLSEDTVRWLMMSAWERCYESGLVCWNDINAPREERRAVFKEVTEDEMVAGYSHIFEFSTWAVLDEAGWREKAKMGWFATHNGSVEDVTAWSKSFIDANIAHEDPETLLVVVDCHI